MADEVVTIDAAELAQLRAAKESLDALTGAKQLEEAKNVIKLHEDAEAAKRGPTVSEALLMQAKAKAEAQTVAGGGFYGLAHSGGGTRGGLLGRGA